MSIDWQQLEDRLVELAGEEIRQFARSHPDEPFYGFALDCGSTGGEISLAAGTESTLQSMVETLKTDRPCMYAEMPDDDIEQELRWELENWEYDGFQSDAFDQGMEPFAEAVSATVESEEQAGLQNEETYLTPTQELFLDAACRAVVRLESTGALDVLNKTDGFRVVVFDYDEPEDLLEARLARARAASTGA